MINNWTGKWLCQMQIPNPVQCTQYSECWNSQPSNSTWLPGCWQPDRADIDQLTTGENLLL
jgi:hypothetical protein